MATAPEIVAAQILDEEIRQLTELKRMAGVPRLFEIMRMIVNGSNGPMTPSERPPQHNPLVAEPKMPPGVVDEETPGSTNPNGLTEAVVASYKRLSRGFTIASIVEDLIHHGFVFVAKKPKVSVADALRRHIGKLVKVTQKGVGRAPNVFEYIGPED